MQHQFATLEELEPECRRHEKRLERQLHIKGKSIVFCIPGRENYAIELSRCNSAESILEWVHHLSEKKWISVELLNRFINLTAEHHELHFRSLSKAGIC